MKTYSLLTLVVSITLCLTGCVTAPPAPASAENNARGTDFDHQQLYFIDRAECEYTVGAYDQVIPASPQYYANCMSQRGWHQSNQTIAPAAPTSNHADALQQAKMFFNHHPFYNSSTQLTDQLYREFHQILQDARYKDLTMYQMLLLAHKKLSLQQRGVAEQ